MRWIDGRGKEEKKGRGKPHRQPAQANAAKRDVHVDQDDAQAPDI
jgi:hypothetical protein